MKSNFLKDILVKIQNVNILENIEKPSNVFEYIELASKLKQNLNKEEVLKQKEELFNSKLSIEERKKLLIQIASIDSPVAYRTLEKFKNHPLAKDIKDFAEIALQHNRVLLQSSLLGEPSILITSGLGGKNNKLRYFLVVFNKELKKFSHWQEKVIKQELLYLSEQNQAELEKLNFVDFYVALKILIPYYIVPSKFVKTLIEKVNFFGDFLYKKYILRNDKIIEEEKIKEKINKLIDIDRKTSNDPKN